MAVSAEDRKHSIAQVVHSLLFHLEGLSAIQQGGGPLREGLRETPERVAKAWIDEWASGYKQDAVALLKTFSDGANGYDEMVVETDIPVYSHCEHHMAPIFGVAHIGYVPGSRIVGLSKLPRVVDVYARRLQVQERLTTQVATALNEGLQPRGVAVVMECRHLCMESRGVRRRGIVTTTSCLLGVLREPAPRAEFFSLVGQRRAV